MEITESEILNAVIVDDSTESAQYLNTIIKQYQPQIKIEKTFKNPVTASKYLVSNPPDVVFLDINMPKVSGMEMAQIIQEQTDTTIVFVTGFREYAFDALQLQIFHYLLKPYTPLDVEKVVQNIITEKRSFKPLEEAMREKVIINKNDKMYFLEANEILCLTAEGSYTNIYTMNGQTIQSSKLLKFYKTEFEDLGYFLEVNRSILINCNHKMEIEKHKNHGNLVLSNGVKIMFRTPTIQHLSRLLSKLTVRGVTPLTKFYTDNNSM